MNRPRGDFGYRQLSEADPSATGGAKDVVWAHATSDMRLSALCDLGRRLKAVRPEITFLVTTDAEQTGSAASVVEGCDVLIEVSDDSVSGARMFLEKWAPSICIWTGGSLKPGLIATAHDRAIPLILVDVDGAGLQSRKRSWFRSTGTNTLECFRTIIANSSAAANHLERLGLPRNRISVGAPLRDSVLPPPCDEGDLAEVNKQLGSRPIWLAAHVQAEELPAILNAHRQAVRMSHRLLLAVAPDALDQTLLMLSRLRASGMRCAVWDPDEDIDDNTQVLVIDDPDALGLWYRIAPLCLLASSLVAGAGGRSPLPAAALGSAILFGPNVRDHMAAYDRLTAKGAAQQVRDAASLGASVLQLIAPDRAANMALAGWEVVTEGADLTNTLLDWVQDALDGGGVHNAPA